MATKKKLKKMKLHPVTIIIGQKEVDNNTISYRLHGSEETITVTFDEFIKLIQDKIQNRI